MGTPGYGTSSDPKTIRNEENGNNKEKTEKITLNFKDPVTLFKVFQAMLSSFKEKLRFEKQPHSLQIHQENLSEQTFSKNKHHHVVKIEHHASKITSFFAKVQDFVVNHVNTTLSALGYEPAENLPPPRPSLPVLSATESSKATVFEQVLEVNGRRFTDQGVRAETVPMVVKGLETKIAVLNKQKDSLKDQAKIAKIKTEIALAQKHLEASKFHEQDDIRYGTPNMPRFAFHALGRERAKKEMLPVLTNLHMQKVYDVNNNKVVSTVSRSGAITDFRNGEVSLQELKDLKDLQNFGDMPSHRKRELENLYVRNDSKDSNSIADVYLNVKAKALVGYGAGSLLIDSPPNQELQSVLNKLQKAKTIESGFAKLDHQEKNLIQNAKISETKLNEVILERSNYLKLLALQDLQLHLETNPASSKSILYTRTSLVDLAKDSVTLFGCVIHERTQGLDMKAVFDELQGAKVVFDCKQGQSSYIDHEGIIHMLPRCAKSGVIETTLDTALFNVCVQGTTTVNTGMQLSVNNSTLNKLEKKYGTNDHYKKLKAKFDQLSRDKTLDPNIVVLGITQFVQSQNGYTGMNCFGGKDRTGYAVALNTHSKICELTKLSPSDPAMKEVGFKLLDKDGVAAQIARAGADHTTLKLSRFDLLLYDTTSNKGKMKRVAAAINGAGIFIKQTIWTRVYNAPPASSTPGQIYRHESVTKAKADSFFKHFKSLGRLFQ